MFPVVATALPCQESEVGVGGRRRSLVPRCLYWLEVENLLDFELVI